MSHGIHHSTDAGQDRTGALPLRSYGPAARTAAEAVGSFAVVLTGLGVTMLNTQSGVPPTLAFGFALLAAMIAFGYISGGHFNPAVTLGSAVAGRTGWGSVLPYILAQLVGGLAAAGLLWLLLSANSQLTDVNGLFAAASNGFEEHSAAQFPLSSVFLAEAVCTALLVAVFLGATAGHAGRSTAPFAVGLTYAALLTLLLPVTNGGLNPARSTASALFTGDWATAQLWLFFAAPLVGAIIAGLAFRSFDAAGRKSVSAPAAPVGATTAAPSDSTGTDTVGTGAAAPAAPPAGPAASIGSPDDARSFFDKGPGTTGRG
ncbi:aquaporin [Arthrobacter zhaoguopingii]|uniref:aquaporin n=1 Tax=Arthrobacter zhaoguopingii TaxID=2681491 RepID=UPI0013567E74|nr:aquaporin [Arthrobacter zhaoguopingii]